MKILMILITLVISLTLSAELWETFTTELPNLNVTAVAIDNNGDKWIGTSGGLTKYDGTNWTHYTTANSGIPSNSVRCLDFNSNGHLLIGTNSGLAIYNKVGQGQMPNNDWIGWTVYNMNNSPLPRNVVSAVKVDDTGTIWIGTLGGGGLAKLSGTDWQVYTTGNSGISNNYIYALEVDAENKLWVGTNYGLASLTGAYWHAFYTNNSELPDNQIRSLAIGSEGEIIIGTLSGGIAFYYGTWWLVLNNSNSIVPMNSITTVAAKQSKPIWFGTETGGLVRYNKTVLSLYNTFETDIISNNIKVIAIEDDRLKWIGTDAGLVLYRGLSVTGISLNAEAVNIHEGNEYQLHFSIEPVDALNQAVAWYVPHPNILTVNNDGLVTTHSAGDTHVLIMANDGGYSAICNFYVSGTVANPESSPPAGTYDEAIFVSMSVGTPNAQIYYTTDESEPDMNSTLYEDDLFIFAPVVIKAKAFREHWIPSETVTMEYIVNPTSVEDLAEPNRPSFTVFPNPFSPKSTRSSTININYYADTISDYVLDIYDIRGRKVNSYSWIPELKGENLLPINRTDAKGKPLSSGVYLLNLKSGDFKALQKLTIVD